MQDSASICTHCGAQIPAHTEHVCSVQSEFTIRHTAIHEARKAAVEAAASDPKSERPGVLSGMTAATSKPSIH